MIEKAEKGKTPTKAKFAVADVKTLKNLFNANLSHSGNKKARMVAEAYLDQLAFDHVEPDAEAVELCLGMLKESRTTEVAEKCDYIINKYLDALLSEQPSKYWVESPKVWPFKDRAAREKREAVAA